MKKSIFTIVALFGAVAINAEEITEVAPEQVNETAQVETYTLLPELSMLSIELAVPDLSIELADKASAQDAISVDPMVRVDTVYLRNPADIEYSQGMLSSKYNYRQFMEQKGLRKWVVQDYIGNDVEPAIFYSANREGLSLSLFGMNYGFDGHHPFGAGIEAVYERKWVGTYLYTAMNKGYEARTSERYEENFPQLHIGLGLLGPALEFPIKFTKKSTEIKSVLQFRVYGEASFKKCSDLKYDQSVYTTTEETEEEYIITTVKKTGELDARPHVFSFEFGIRAQLDFGGTPFYLFGMAGVGGSQNFTYSETQWHRAEKFRFGFGCRIFTGMKYNHDNMKRAGRTKSQVKKHPWW